MSLSRRQFIQASGIALCAGAVPLKASAAGQQQPLPVPPLLESRRGQPLFMTVQRAHWSFTPGTRASVWGINGRYLGPTIRVWKGDDVKLIYSNRLTENVSMTVAGLQVPGPLMGGPARMMSPNADWAPVLPIRQNAATLWYHANTPNRTAQQVYNGLAGMWLGGGEVSKLLPSNGRCLSPTIMVWMIFLSLFRINGWITLVRQNITNREAAALLAIRYWLTVYKARTLKSRVAGCACVC